MNSCSFSPSLSSHILSFPPFTPLSCIESPPSIAKSMAITQEEESPMAWMAKGKRSQPKHQPRCHQPSLFTTAAAATITTVSDISTYTPDELEIAQSLLLLYPALQSACNPGPASALAPGSVNALPDSESHQCDECGKTGFKSLWSLRRHQTSHARSVSAGLAKSDKEEMHRCDICQSEFQMGQALGGHKRAHYSWPNGRVRRVGSGSETNPSEVEKRPREEDADEAISDFQSNKC